MDDESNKISRVARALEARQERKDANSSALVATRGNLPMVVARNAGEAKNARKDTKLFREQKRFNDHALKVGKIHNSQKHWRDPLLQ